MIHLLYRAGLSCVFASHPKEDIALLSSMHCNHFTSSDDVRQAVEVKYALRINSRGNMTMRLLYLIWWSPLGVDSLFHMHCLFRGVPNCIRPTFALDDLLKRTLSYLFPFFDRFAKLYIASIRFWPFLEAKCKTKSVCLCAPQGGWEDMGSVCTMASRMTSVFWGCLQRTFQHHG